MRLWPFAVALPILALAGWSAFSVANTDDSRLISNLKECPRRWTDLLNPKTHDSIFGANARNSIAGARTNVPEYHDCQRLIADGEYGPLVAVFASDSINDLENHLGFNSVSVDTLQPVDSIGAVPNQGTDTGVVAVQILNTGLEGNSGYSPLLIRGGNFAVSCVYLYTDSVGWNAWLHQVPYPQVACPLRLRRDQADTVMVVSAYRISGFTASDYPPVARWDWDGTEQFIGTKCGQAWCQLAFKKTDYGPRGSGGRVYEIKGWYDRQWLAKPGVTAPLSVAGIVIPDPMLDGYSNVDVFRNKWQHAATVMIGSDTYLAKANFKRRPAGTRLANHIYFRTRKVFRWSFNSYPKTGSCVLRSSPEPNAWWSDKPKWYKFIWEALIIPADDSSSCVSKIYRVTRCPNTRDPMTFNNQPVDVIGTARWRWLAKDETIWAECAQGCCQIEPL